MNVIPLIEHLGVEIRDFTVADLDTPDGLRVLRDAFDSGLVLIRDQRLSAEEHDRLVAALGDLHRFPSGNTYEFMSNVVHEPHNVAGVRRLLFHNDGSYGAHVAPGTCLYAMEVSSTSPPTAFANTVRAYENLPADVRRTLDGLHCFNTFNLTAALRDEEPSRYRMADHPEPREDIQLKTAVHPAVITVPHTGQQAIFVSEFNASHFVELGPDSREGEELLQLVFATLYDEANVYTHKYATGDVVIWNNLSTQHARVARIDTAPRTFRRLVLSSLSW
ncbi:MAG: TauD/TfdA family dioxygenase [Kibdelosporangium sp.]